METVILETKCKENKKNPVQTISRKTSELLNNYKDELGQTKWKLLVSNPVCPRLYGLPKLHKDGIPMRPVVSNICAPTEKLAKWLVEEFKKLKAPFSFSVENSIDFTSKMKNVRIEDDEVMCSFDVKSLFPNTPLKESVEELKIWLDEQDIPDNRASMFLEMTTFCLKNSFFQFNGKFFKQLDGTAMGMALGPFISSDIYLGSLEKKIATESWFPKTWYRYVDDVFAIIKSDEVNLVLEKLNKLHPSIQFTHEIENLGQLPFLDILVKKTENKFQFQIYRKPTSTDRYIPSTSHHCFEQKMAAFNSMVYRLLNVPLCVEEKSKEEKRILDIASKNGYSGFLIKNIIKKQKKHKRLKDLTTLSFEKTNLKRKKIPYCPPLSLKFKNIFKKVGCLPVFSSKNKLNNLLANNKDKIEVNNFSGIYSIQCSSCELIYIGQSRRACIQRYNEHIRHISKNEPLKSSVAYHFLENIDHHFDKENFKIEKRVNEPQKLDFFESFFMKKFSQRLMNLQPPPLRSILLDF